MRLNVYSMEQGPLLHIRYMGCNRLPDTVRIVPTVRSSYIIHYVTKGRGYYNGTPVAAGQGFLIYPGHTEAYWADPSDPWELLWIVSEDPNIEKLFPFYCADAQTQVFFYDFIPAVRHICDALQMLSSKVVSSAVLLELFLGLYKYHDRATARKQDRPKADIYAEFAMRYMHDHYASPISVLEIAELLGVSQPYLFRIFKTATGKAPKQYLNDYRILQAKKLLTETAMPITEIAESVGYADALAFSKFFSSKTGTSPRAYRQAAFHKP